MKKRRYKIENGVENSSFMERINTSFLYRTEMQCIFDFTTTN
ncbi:hypothetical protein [Crocinitomix algicola]|nr:hypothetical protein [Crocinitomix algicola]